MAFQHTRQKGLNEQKPTCDDTCTILAWTPTDQCNTCNHCIPYNKQEQQPPQNFCLSSLVQFLSIEKKHVGAVPPVSAPKNASREASEILQPRMVVPVASYPMTLNWMKVLERLSVIEDVMSLWSQAVRQAQARSSVFVLSRLDPQFPIVAWM